MFLDENSIFLLCCGCRQISWGNITDISQNSCWPLCLSLIWDNKLEDYDVNKEPDFNNISNEVEQSINYNGLWVRYSLMWSQVQLYHCINNIPQLSLPDKIIDINKCALGYFNNFNITLSPSLLIVFISNFLHQI